VDDELDLRFAGVADGIGRDLELLLPSTEADALGGLRGVVAALVNFQPRSAASASNPSRTASGASVDVNVSVCVLIDCG